MDNLLKTIKEIRSLKGFENLKELLGEDLGDRLYKVLNSAEEEIKIVGNVNFDRGVVWACARLVDGYDLPSVAKDIADEANPNYSECAEFDVKLLRKEVPSIPKGTP